MNKTNYRLPTDVIKRILISVKQLKLSEVLLQRSSRTKLELHNTSFDYDCTWDQVTIVLPINSSKTLRIQKTWNSRDYYGCEDDEDDDDEVLTDDRSYVTCCLDEEDGNVSLRLIFGRIQCSGRYQTTIISPTALELESPAHKQARARQSRGLMQLVAFGAQDVYLKG